MYSLCEMSKNNSVTPLFNLADVLKCSAPTLAAYLLKNKKVMLSIKALFNINNTLQHLGLKHCGIFLDLIYYQQYIIRHRYQVLFVIL